MLRNKVHKPLEVKLLQVDLVLLSLEAMLEAELIETSSKQLCN